MNRKSLIYRFFSLLLSASLLASACILPAAHAGIIGTADLLDAKEQRLVAREQVLSALNQSQVRDQLLGMGVDPAQVEKRVSSLSNAELENLATQLEQLPAGGNSDPLGIIVLIFLVLLITDILGFTDVFPFVKKHAR